MVPDSQPADLLLDFLYVDRDRLSAYAAQLFNAGVLASTKTADSTNNQTAQTVGPRSVASFSGHQATVTSLEHTFDASHTLPINVLDRLNELGYIRDGLEAAALGDLFMASGSVRIVDYTILRECWSSIGSIAAAEQQAKGQHKKPAAKSNERSLLELIKNLPHSTEIMLQAGQRTIWGYLRPEFLRTPSATISFAYGTELPGSWHIIAALDALPDEMEDQTNHNPPPIFTELQLGMVEAMKTLRGVFGRPAQAYAATPLLVFRHTSAAPVAELEREGK